MGAHINLETWIFPQIYVVTMTTKDRPSVLITVHSAEETLTPEELKKKKMKERSKINRRKKKNEAIARYIEENGDNTEKLTGHDIKKLVEENQKNKREILEATEGSKIRGF